jgi:hypothetical protein
LKLQNKEEDAFVLGLSITKKIFIKMIVKYELLWKLLLINDKRMVTGVNALNVGTMQWHFFYFHLDILACIAWGGQGNVEMDCG